MAVGESSLTRVYGPLLTMTLDEILASGLIQDNVYNMAKTLAWFRTGNRIKVLQGGERIRIPIMSGTNGTFKWYTGYDNLNITPQIGQTTAWYTWKQAAIGLAIDGLSLRNNAGPAQINDIMTEKIRQGELSMGDGIATGIFSDGTGSANKQLTGLSAAVDTTPADTSYAGIDPADNTAWRNRAVATVGDAAANLISNMRNVYNSCSRGSEGVASSPDFIVTTQSIHEALEALIAPRVRYEQNPSGGADAGIETLKFKGAEVIWDDYCTAGTMYMLNSAHIMMFVHGKANFAMSDEGFQKPIDQDALVANILFQGNVAVNNRRKLGVLAGIS